MRSKVVVRCAMIAIVPTMYLILVGALTAIESGINRPATAVILVIGGIFAFIGTAVTVAITVTELNSRDSNPSDIRE